MPRFRTSARTVDMLGRQQIAGIPTAISELFKNAHDAYATRVEADYFRPENLLVLRDNGFGMTLKDITERWLVLGIDSRPDRGSELDTIAADLDLPIRSRTGEKGIGRLAIAAIGPQVLLVTQARRADGLHPLVASFVNWSIFELPGIALDEIDVPVLEYEDNDLPNAKDLSTLVGSVRANLHQLRKRTDRTIVDRIEQELDQASFDVGHLQERFATGRLDGSNPGTHFYIQPTDPMLAAALDAKPELRRIGDLQKTLMGFANTMVPERSHAPISTVFRDHPSPDFHESVIGPEEFFTPEEFANADHAIQGTFDEYGQFAGTVSVYGRLPEPHIIAWPQAAGRETACGPFTIDFAYLQGRLRESRMARDDWSELSNKLSRMGGLYIYRNGIRILPYGNTDYDFLNIEERRNLGAGYYFFSYRRIFGVIELPLDSSTRLIEKAGREGFRDNRAYRQFRSILENFFVQLAADFFRDEAVHGTLYGQVKSELDRQHRARQRQEQQSRERRRRFEESLHAKATNISGEQPTATVNTTIDRLTASLIAAAQLSDPDDKLRAIVAAEMIAHDNISELRNQLRVPQPRGFALSKSLRRDLLAYRAEYSRLDEEVLKPAIAAVHDLVEDAARDLDASRRRRFDAAAQAAWSAARESVSASRRNSEELLRATQDLVGTAMRQAMVDLESELNDIAQRVQRTDLAELDESQLVQLRIDFDDEIESIAARKREQLDAIARQLESISVVPDEFGDIVSQEDIAGAVEEQLLALQERAEADLELTQLGMAIEIIDHEFQATIRSIRNNLRRFRAWADVNEQLADVYNNIRVSFDHLDSYLTLFTPLHRRLYRTKVTIKGSEIGRFLEDLFKERLNRHQVDLKISSDFKRHRLEGFPSSFYPVFVALVDNAIFWLQDRALPRIIRLDSIEGMMIVADNGPGMPLRDREVAFEFGFTRKPGGRGLGLYISKQVLTKAGYDLLVSEPLDEPGTVFTLCPLDDTDDD